MILMVKMFYICSLEFVAVNIMFTVSTVTHYLSVYVSGTLSWALRPVAAVRPLAPVTER